MHAIFQFQHGLGYIIILDCQIDSNSDFDTVNYASTHSFKTIMMHYVTVAMHLYEQLQHA